MKHRYTAMDQTKNIPRRLDSIQSTRKNSQKQKQKTIHLDPSFNQMSELRKSPGLPLLKFNIFTQFLDLRKGLIPLYFTGNQNPT
jgi:hypothetical protein